VNAEVVCVVRFKVSQSSGLCCEVLSVNQPNGVCCPENQEGALESLNGPIDLAIDIYLDFFVGYFQLFLVYLEKLLRKIHLDF
jgi:hypothetical protein